MGAGGMMGGGGMMGSLNPMNPLGGGGMGNEAVAD